MAMIPMNATEFESAGVREDFGTIPPDDYVVAIVESEYLPTNAGDGNYIKFKMQILQEGEYNGRFLWDQINIDNPNQKAVEIAKKTFNQILLSTNMWGKVGTDLDVLNGIAMVASVIVEPPKGEYAASNRVKSYKPYGATETTATAPTVASQQTAAATTTPAPATTPKTGLPPFLKQQAK